MPSLEKLMRTWTVVSILKIFELSRWILLSTKPQLLYYMFICALHVYHFQIYNGCFIGVIKWLGVSLASIAHNDLIIVKKIQRVLAFGFSKGEGVCGSLINLMEIVSGCLNWICWHILGPASTKWVAVLTANWGNFYKSGVMLLLGTSVLGVWFSIF